jgi:hypothetical protein
MHDRMVIIIVHDTNGCLVSISFHSSHSPAIVSGEPSRAETTLTKSLIPTPSKKLKQIGGN